ncbi:hypothetical protein MnTg02_02135 [bacterium MnTg02]|nr:hypothetical protein MnTg02_02135 [bacterium MnTg02]
MGNKIRKIEIFSANCPVCVSAIEQVKEAACPSCEIQVLDMGSTEVQKRAAELGIRSVPAVLIDGRFAICCEDRGIDLGVLRAAGLGQAIT